MDAIAVIPARLGSTRLARKVLREIAGRPMLAHVYTAVRASRLLRDVIVATDAEEVATLCRAQGWTCRMTSVAHRSGTERVHEVAGVDAADVYVNVQGDEPMVRPEHLGALLSLMSNSGVSVGTLKTPLAADEAQNPNVVKVVTDLAGRALYFSRSAIPFDRDNAGTRYFKHLGLYAYRKPALDRFCTLPESSLERAERLEQLRFLENGITIHVTETPYDTISVDTEEDLRRVEALMKG
jgi:3-deoxy-manno-octulosonate cytidylyltransferase (CMP-KDO synthetase)